MNRCKARGFFLIEFTLATLLIAFMGMLMIPAFRGTERIIVAAQVERLYAFLQLMRSEAIVTNSKIVITIDELHNQLLYKYPVPLGQSVRLAVIPGAYGPPSQPTKLLTHASSFEHGHIIFYPEGTISPGCLYITDANKTILYAVSVSVSQQSLIRKYYYEAPGWILLT